LNATPRHAMTGALTRRMIGIGLGAAAVIAADQLTKQVALEHLANGPKHILGPLSFELGFNTGGAFSLGSDFSGAIILGAIAALFVIGSMTRRFVGKTATVAFALVFGGALSNLGDRIFRGRHGAVVDFVHLGFWPTFNVADSAITVGCVLLVVLFWRGAFRTEGGVRVSGEAHK
jgi:signal peptidase II